MSPTITQPTRPPEGVGAPYAPPTPSPAAELRRLRHRNRELTHRLSAQLQLAGLLLADHRAALPTVGDAGYDAAHAAHAALIRAEVQLRTLVTVNRALLNSADEHACARTVLTKVAEGMQHASPRPFRLLLDVAPVRLPAGEMTALALLVNELLTNSIRHAFAAAHGGDTRRQPAPRVTLSLKPEGGRLHLRYGDNGPGVDAESLGGYGGEIIATLLNDLGAEWGESPRPGYRISARWAAVVE